MTMHTFKVVKEPYGWAVRLGPCMSTPFRTRAGAIQGAEQLCASLRAHGQLAEVEVEGLAAGELPQPPDRLASARFAELLQRTRLLAP